MTHTGFITRAAIVTGAAAMLAGLAPLASASAAPVPPKPSPSCKVPVFSVAPLKAKPGSKVTVSGLNFSGCPAQGNTTKPTPVLTVKIGVESASKMGAVLATTQTTATGTFSVTVTVPALASNGVPKLELVAAATDPATKLTYAGVAILAYDVASAAPTSTAPGGGVPTAVPAGSGGHAAVTTAAAREEQYGALGAGVLLLGLGGAGIRSRRTRRH